MKCLVIDCIFSDSRELKLCFTSRLKKTKKQRSKLSKKIFFIWKKHTLIPEAHNIENFSIFLKMGFT